MQSTDSKERKSGAYRSCTAHSEVQHDPSQNDTTTTRSAECVVVLPFAVIRKCWFQNANRLPRSIVAKLMRGGAGDFRNLGLSAKERDERQQAYDNKEKRRGWGERETGGMERDGRQQAHDNKGETVDCTTTTDKHGR